MQIRLAPWLFFLFAITHSLYSSGLTQKPALSPRPLPTSSYFKPNQDLVYKKITYGETLQALLRKHGFTDSQVRELTAKKTIPKGFALIPGEAYRVSFVGAKGRNEVKVFDRIEDTSYTFWREGRGRCDLEVMAEAFSIKTRTISGKIRGSLISSIQNLVPDQFVALRFMDAFVLNFKLPKVLARNAPFSLTVEEKYEGTHFIKFGEILNAQLKINGETVTRHFVKFPDGGGAFIDPRDLQTQRPFFSPVSYMQFSSLFNKGRIHPIKRRRIAHLGVDFVAPLGAPVYAVASGTIMRAGRTRGAGNFVSIRHADGVETYYDHLSQIETGVRSGMTVDVGQRIGFVGCTGYCTRAHLHFAVKKRGQYVDPLPYLKSYAFQDHSLVKKVVATQD